jgi:hypothetical protein
VSFKSTAAALFDWLGLTPVREQLGALGSPTDEPGFRRLTQAGEQWLRRDLTPLAQDYQQRLVFWLWESNPLAKWLIETTVDFTLGEGATITSEDEDVQKVIHEFWVDPVNRLDARMDTFAREYGLYGELCLPVAVNEVDGHVRLAYVDPLQIDQVLTHPDNALITTGVLLKSAAGQQAKLLKVIRGETDRESRAYGYYMPNVPGERDPRMGRPYDGACFLFQANRVSNAKRGRSDLLADIDWLDGYDRFLFDSMDAASLLNTYVWDVTMEGATEAQIREWLKAGNSAVKRNMVRVHNEKVKWNAVVPDLKAQDKDDYARLLRSYILGAHSFPEHWYGTSSGATFATAKEMGVVPVKHLTRRQKEIRLMLTDLVTFVLDQAVLHKRLPETATIGAVAGEPGSGIDKPTREAFRIILPELSMRDQTAIVAALAGLTAALQQAQSQGWLRPETAARVFATVVSQLGDDINPQEEYRPGTGPAGDMMKDYAQLTPRLIAQLGRAGKGNAENMFMPKLTTPMGGQPSG